MTEHDHHILTCDKFVRLKDLQLQGFAQHLESRDRRPGTQTDDGVGAARWRLRRPIHRRRHLRPVQLRGEGSREKAIAESLRHLDKC